MEIKTRRGFFGKMAAMVAVANYRDLKRSRAPYSRPVLSGDRGTKTSRHALDQRVTGIAIHDHRSRLVAENTRRRDAHASSPDPSW